MPRGPGKKGNYNLDYSRFNYLDRNTDENENDSNVKSPEDSEPMPDGMPPMPDGMPPMQELLRTMPPELQEAYHLMSVGRANGDKAAEQRANELALKAIQNGGPQVQQDFIKTLAKHEPEAAKAMAEQMGLQPKPENPADKCGGLSDQIDFLKDRMEKGAEQARLQMESLTKQQEQMEQLAAGGPEDFMKFMQTQGMSEGDMQEIFGGNEKHMEKCLRGMIDKSVTPDAHGRMEDPEATVKAAEELHRTICGDGDEDDTNYRDSHNVAAVTDAPDSPVAPVRTARSEWKEEVKIAEHRLQYQKDADGHYTSVELRCTLPGVADMNAITLDVSEKHIRVNTSGPALKYVANAGPFPVLIDPGAARAKFSKKKQELSISVPAKAN